MLNMSTRSRKFMVLALALGLMLIPAVMQTIQVGAADHGDGPGASVDRSADINDVYFFLDPADSNRVVVVMTMHGFIVPAEAVNFGVFDHNLRYRFELESSGDAVADGVIDVTFSEKINSGATPQTATVTSSFFPTFTAPTTAPNLNVTGPTPVVTNDTASGISFYAGLSDDPFFFDIPGFNRFVASVLAGAPNLAALQRGRDSFAGYNTLSIAMSLPVSLLRGRLNVVANTLGVSVRTQRRTGTIVRTPSRFGAAAQYADVDRLGVPAVNVVLVPFSRKNEYNLASPVDDANGRFAGSIVGTLTALGTDQTSIGILASVAVAKGDFLRLDLTKANAGPGGGNNASVGFPNGRRLSDDVVDTLLFLVANRTVIGDNVNANDVPFRDTFPFLGLAQQPRESGDDNTKN